MKRAGTTLILFLFFLSLASGGKKFQKWNEYIRKTRQTNDLSFIPVDKKYLCPRQPDTRYDALGRRKSGLLVPPESQGTCGNCWAFASAHTYADQININENARRTALSTEHLTRCFKADKIINGCCGSSPSEFLPYLETTGFQRASCLPYTLESYIPEGLPELIERLYKSLNPLTCPSNCEDGSSYNALLLQGYTEILREEVMSALNRGPVWAGILVTADDLGLGNYGCGVIEYPSSYLLLIAGLHAVEIVDYSSDTYTETPFFVVKNSWGNLYGENGYFRIAQNAPVFLEFFSFNATSSKTISTSTSRMKTCAPTEINKDDPIIEIAAEFGLEELTNSSLVRCRGSDIVPTLTLKSIINGTHQIIEGLLFDITVTARVSGCDYTSATVRLTVMQGLDQSFTLSNYYYEEIINSNITSATSYPIFCFYTLLLTLLSILAF